MLQELRIENLGVIEQVNLVLEGGLIALTGETGAGKTMIVEAISLLVGSAQTRPSFGRVPLKPRSKDVSSSVTKN